jgi:hypothetical protein
MLKPLQNSQVIGEYPFTHTEPDPQEAHTLCIICRDAVTIRKPWGLRLMPDVTEFGSSAWHNACAEDY